MKEIDYSLLDRDDISSTMFHARFGDWLPPLDGASDHIVSVGGPPSNGGTWISCRFFPYDKSSPSILYFHGNGEVVSDYNNMYRHSRQYGINIFAAEYRGYGASYGTPTFSNMLSDAHDIYDYFRNFLLAQGYVDKLFVMGRSMGASPALELASHYQESFKGIIIESGSGGVNGWDRWIRPSDDPGAWNRMTVLHMEKLKSITLPLLTIHGEVDDIIPLSRAIELQEAVSSHPKELIVIPKAGHNTMFVVGMNKYMESLSKFVTD